MAGRLSRAAFGQVGPVTARAVIRSQRAGLWFAVGTAAAFVVWFVGLDPFWAVATVLAVGPVGAVLASLTFDDDAPWDPLQVEPPRGSRITMATITDSLAACDRLARHSAVRRLRGIVISEREDRLARLTVLRRMRALLTTELNDRGLDPANASHKHDIVQLFGPAALTILQPNDGTPVTSAAIARCLDAVERLGTETPRSA